MLVVSEINSLCRATHLMRCQIADKLGVCEKTLIRWQNGKTVMDLIHYFRLLNLVNDRKIGVKRCA